MTWTYTDATPTKTCTGCGKSKPLDMFPADRAGRGRTHRAQCKECKNKSQLAERKRRRLRTKQEALEAAAQRAVDVETKNVVPARSFMYHWDQTYKPEPYYVRNNGNKHIPSRGV